VGVVPKPDFQRKIDACAKQGGKIDRSIRLKINHVDRADPLSPLPNRVC